MRHAILILAHEGPDALLRLVRRLRHERIQVFVHLDTKSVGRFDIPVLEESGARVLSTRSISWAGFEMCLAELDLLDAAAQAGPFHSYSLISGRDYPVQTTDAAVAMLDTLETSRMKSIQGRQVQRHLRHYERLFFMDSPNRRLLNALSRRVYRVLPDRRPPHGIDLHFGWQWWTLLDDAVQTVRQFVADRPDFMRWSARTWAPDEFFFQTILESAAPRPPLSPEHLRYIQFEDNSHHPRVLGLEDVPDLVRSEGLFARKFDERQHPGALDALDLALGEKQDRVSGSMPRK